MGVKGPRLRLYADANVIQALMTLRGVTGVRDLARKAGVPVEATQRFTSGKVVDVTTSHADKFAAALKVDISFLFIERRSSLDLEDLAA